MRRRSASFATLVAIAAALMFWRAPAASAFDYAHNGGFEEGSDGWSANYAEISTADASTLPPAEGAWAGRVVLQSSPYQVRQATYFDVPPGRYEFSAAVLRRASSPLITVQVQSSDRDTSTVTEVVGPVDTWLTVSGTIDVYKSQNMQLSFIGSGVSGDVFFIDAVRFEGAPPATATPTATATAAPSGTPTPTATGTRTPSPTRTASPTKTATATKTPDDATLTASLRNGGFEGLTIDGAPLDWERFGGSMSIATQPVHSGERSARFESASDSTKWMYQRVAVSAGDTSSFDAWIEASDANVSSAFLRVSWYATEDATGSAVGSADSTSRADTHARGFVPLTTGPIVVPDGVRSAKLRVMLQPASAAGAVIYVDDASFGHAEVDRGAAGAPAGRASAQGVSRTIQTLSGTNRPGQNSASLAAGSSQVVINEVLYDPDNGPNDADGEWVELYNTGDSPADVSGWSIADGVSGDALPALTVPPHGYAIIAASDSFRDAYPGVSAPVAVLGGRIGNGLGNDGDALALSNGSGVVDAISWGRDESRLRPPVADVPAGHSIERRLPGMDTDAGDDFVDNESPSPGSALSSPPPKPKLETGSASAVPIGAASSNRLKRALPWALVALSVAALGGTLAWRLAPLVSQRLRAAR